MTRYSVTKLNSLNTLLKRILKSYVMAFLGVAGNGTIIAGQLVTVVARPGIGSRAGRELGEALSLGRW